MGCDCGCGGECPMCSRILGIGMADRSSQINEVLEKEELLIEDSSFDDEEDDKD